MIKLLRFSHDETAPWTPRRSSMRPLIAPLRVTSNRVLVTDHTSAASPHSIEIAYFADTTHLERFKQAIADRDEAASSWIDAQATTEIVLRGDAWLADRWFDVHPRYKHMALARRADGLTPAEFAERWKAHAGSAGATPIPDALRGLAYAQNHPLPWPDDPLWDAVNEVWFDDLDAVRARHQWLADALSDDPGDDLFGARHLLIVEEQLVDLS